jgi:hypothetical protein
VVPFAKLAAGEWRKNAIGRKRAHRLPGDTALKISPRLADWFHEHRHWLLIAAAAVVFGSGLFFLQRLKHEPKNLYRILIECPRGYLALGPHNVTDAVVGAHFDDRGVVELWIGLNPRALTRLVALSESNDQICDVLLGEVTTVSIDLARALNDDVLTVNEVPTAFAERFVGAAD